MRLRITFAKTEAMRYTGHLDLHRTWERIFRRVNLPLAYSQGFHPQPRLNLACALPLGFTSECEVLDAWLEHDLPITEISNALDSSIPPGINILNIHSVDQHLPALQTQVLSAEYQVMLLDSPPDLGDRVIQILNSTSLPRIRRNKAYDLRPLIENIQINQNSSGQKSLFLRMRAREAFTGRPEELLAELNIPFQTTRIHRTRLIFSAIDE